MTGMPAALAASMSAGVSPAAQTVVFGFKSDRSLPAGTVVGRFARGLGTLKVAVASTIVSWGISEHVGGESEASVGLQCE